MNNTFSCRSCGERLPQTGDAFCTFCHEPLDDPTSHEVSPSKNLTHMDRASQAKSPSIRSPHHAWLAPLFGIGASILITACTSHARETTDSKIVEMLPGLAFIAFLLFGLFKSIQCLLGARRVGHGIAGLLVNGAALLLVGLMLFVTISAIQNRNSPETRVRIAAQQLEKELPVQVDDTTTLVRAFVGPPSTLNIKYEVHGIPFDALGPEAINQIEMGTRESVGSSPLGELLSNGAHIHYIYQHEGGKVLFEFTIQGTVSAPEL